MEGVAWRAGLRTGDFLIEVIKDSASFTSSSAFISQQADDDLEQRSEREQLQGSDLRCSCGHEADIGSLCTCKE